jgi:hypothetical protein
VPSANLGEVGQQQGEAVNFNWKWSYSAPGFVIWLVLILAIVLPKANHNPRILLILVPLVIAYLFWLALKKVSSMPSSSAAQFDTVFQSVAVGIAVLWLVVNYFKRFGGFVRFLLSFVILVTVAGLSTLSYSTDFSNETILFLALSAFQAITILGATTAAGKLCGWRYRPPRFMLWLAVWMLLCSLFAMFGFFIIGNAIMSSGSVPDILETIKMLTLVGLIFGLCLYLINLPFMILGFADPFFRKRFNVCLCPKSTPTTALSS